MKETWKCLGFRRNCWRPRNKKLRKWRRFDVKSAWKLDIGHMNAKVGITVWQLAQYHSNLKLKDGLVSVLLGSWTLVDGNGIINHILPEVLVAVLDCTWFFSGLGKRKYVERTSRSKQLEKNMKTEDQRKQLELLSQVQFANLKGQLGIGFLDASLQVLSVWRSVCPFVLIEKGSLKTCLLYSYFLCVRRRPCWRNQRRPIKLTRRIRKKTKRYVLGRPVRLK